MNIKNKQKKLNYLFELVEANDIDSIKLFFTNYPIFKENHKYLVATNGWHPWLFAARFGYSEMLQYFIETFRLHENVAGSSAADLMSNLILLTIHSGSLNTMYYLALFVQPDIRKINGYLINAVLLEKLKLCVYFIVKGSYIVDMVTPKKFETNIKCFCYNCYYTIEGDSNIHYYNKNGEAIQFDTDKMIKVIDNKQCPYYLKVIHLFKSFNQYLLSEISKKGFVQNNRIGTNYFKVMDTVDNSTYLNNIVTGYFI